MADELRCRCRHGCKAHATQEDMHCDDCRDPAHCHVFVAPVGADPDASDEWVHVGFTKAGFQ